MSFATITSKGQVTIPKDIRDSLQLRSGDKIEIVVTHSGEAVIRRVSPEVDDVFKSLHREGRRAVSVDQMKDAIRRRITRRRSCEA